MIRTLNEQDTDAFLALKRRGLTTDPDLVFGWRGAESLGQRNMSS
jgi:hypothetical protein